MRPSLTGMLPLLLCFFSTVLHAETKQFDLHACIETALRNQPAIRVAKEGVNAGLGRSQQALSTYYPQISLSTGYNEEHSLSGPFGNILSGVTSTFGNASPETVTKSYTTTLQVNQTIYDFGRTGNASDAAEWGVRSSERDADRVALEVVLNVKQAYYALLQAKRLVAVAQKTVEQTESHLKQAQAFFQAGSKPRFDVTRAEVDVNNARLGLINAKSSVRIRTIALNNAMGIVPGEPIDIKDTVPEEMPVPTLEQAERDALRNRPEMMKAGADIEAARARVKAEESNYWPTLSASGAYNWATGRQDLGSFNGVPLVGDIQNNWNAGVLLTIPLFQGGVTKGRVSEARANLITLEAQRDAMKQSILLEVNQAMADIESAVAREEVMDLTVKKAGESLELAQGRYDAGFGPHIEVTDAQLAAVNAETDRIQAQYDYQLAAARLHKAMGIIEP